MSDDDHDWAEALAGHERDGGDAAAQRAARLLRHAHRRWPTSSPAALQVTGDADDAARERALIERARELGLLRPRTRWCNGCAERWRRWASSPWRMGAAGLVLASTLFALVILSPLLLRQPDEPVLRAGADGVLLLRDRDPRARRDRIADALTAAGVPVQRYERLGRWGIDADWPQPASAAASAALQAERLPAPAGATLRIEVETQPP